LVISDDFNLKNSFISKLFPHFYSLLNNIENIKDEHLFLTFLLSSDFNYVYSIIIFLYSNETDFHLFEFTENKSNPLVLFWNMFCNVGIYLVNLLNKFQSHIVSNTFIDLESSFSLLLHRCLLLFTGVVKICYKFIGSNNLLQETNISACILSVFNSLSSIILSSMQLYSIYKKNNKLLDLNLTNFISLQNLLIYFLERLEFIKNSQEKVRKETFLNDDDESFDKDEPLPSSFSSLIKSVNINTIKSLHIILLQYCEVFDSFVSS
jgi:hypothetical protein